MNTHPYKDISSTPLLATRPIVRTKSEPSTGEWLRLLREKMDRVLNKGDAGSTQNRPEHLDKPY